MKECTEITLRYKENGNSITVTYRVSKDILRRARSWHARTNLTARDLADWLQNRGGELHRTGGPAYVVRYPDGCFREEYYANNQRHRVGGPAVVVSRADGSTTYEAYYAGGKFVKETKVPALSAIPGVTIRRGLPPPGP